MSWTRIRTVVRGAQAAISTEPKTLAPLKPLVEDAVAILSKPPTEEAKEELTYLLTKIQEFVIPWRPSPEPDPGFFYMQPNWAKSTDDQAGEALQLLKALPPIETDTTSRPLAGEDGNRTMKVFVSHSSADAAVAGAFVELLRSALSLPAKDIRCTSVEGYKLSAGADSNEQLRAEVFGSETFVALLSPISMKSVYVMFELGARWGTKRHLAPIMVCGTKTLDLKAPLSGIHAISGASESDIHQLIADIGQKLSQRSEGPAVYAKALREFIRKAKATAV